MPNWCITAYTFTGEPDEIDRLFHVMKDLQDCPFPRVANGFEGITNQWLGNVVDALGGDWEKIYCRGTFCNLFLEDGKLMFDTETAWAPMDEFIEFLCQVFPTLNYVIDFCDDGT